MRFSNYVKVFVISLIVMFVIVQCGWDFEVPSDKMLSGTIWIDEDFPQGYKCGSGNLEIPCYWIALPAGIEYELWFEGAKGSPSQERDFESWHKIETYTHWPFPQDVILEWSGLDSLETDFYHFWAFLSNKDSTSTPKCQSLPVSIRIEAEDDNALFADLWSGERIKGRRNENLRRGIYWLNFQIVTYDGIGQNNIPVNFETTDGTLKHDNMDSSPADDGEGFVLDGIVENGITLPGYVAECTVTVTPNSVIYDPIIPYKLIIKCQEDEEKSILPGFYTHLKDAATGLELPGDNLEDHTSEDPDMTKDVYIEVDYSDSACTRNEMKNIVEHAIFALERAKVHPDSNTVYSSGIKVHWDTTSNPPDSIDSLPARLTRKNQEDFLLWSRSNRNYIHCILATANDTTSYPIDTHDAALGFTVEFYRYQMHGDSIGGLGWTAIKNFWTCVKYSFGKDRKPLDRTGGYVYIDKIREKYYKSSPNDTIWLRVAAVVLAHEIGHCLGMDHTVREQVGKNLMDGLQDQVDDWQWGERNFFNYKTLQDCDTSTIVVEGAMNVRGSLGVTTVTQDLSVWGWSTQPLKSGGLNETVKKNH